MQKKLFLFTFLAWCFICAPIHTIKAIKQKIILCGIKDVLLITDISAIVGARAGSFIGYTPEVVENELYDILHGIKMKNSKIKGFSSGLYSPLMCHWLLVPHSSAQVQRLALEYIDKKSSFFKKLRLRESAKIAFTPSRSAQALKQNRQMVELIRSCRSHGHTMVAYSNWNQESFIALTQLHKSLFALFDKQYISGNLGSLTFQEPFFKTILTDLQAQPHGCYLIDSQQEAITAARSLGIPTHRYTSPATTQQALQKNNLL